MHINNKNFKVAYNINLSVKTSDKKSNSQLKNTNWIFYDTNDGYNAYYRTAANINDAMLYFIVAKTQYSDADINISIDYMLCDEVLASDFLDNIDMTLNILIDNQKENGIRHYKKECERLQAKFEPIENILKLPYEEIKKVLEYTATKLQ